jgi:hypothetical protein
MAEPRGGGYVISMKHHANVVGHMKIDNATLLKVVKALGIQRKAPNVNVEKGIADVETIYICRGP